MYEFKIDAESDFIDDDNNDDDDDFNHKVAADTRKQNHNGYLDPSHDPLSSVLNNDTEIGKLLLKLRL